MHPQALKSRLRALCENTGVEWSESNTPRTLARRLSRAVPERFEQWQREYMIVYNDESGKFIDVREAAYAAVVLDRVDEVFND